MAERFRKFEELANSLSNGGWGMTREESVKWDRDDMRLAAIIDIMQSLRAIRRVLECGNTQQMPFTLKSLERMGRQLLAKPKKKRKRVKRAVAA